MKLLILFLITFNVYSQTRIDITPKNPKVASLHFVEATKKLANKRLKKMVRESQWLKGHWEKFESKKSIFKKRKTNVDEISSIIDDGLEMVGLLSVDEYDYFIPDNFTIETDHKYGEKLALKEATHKKERDLEEVERKLDLKHNGSVGEWRLKIMRSIRQLRKDCR